MQHWDPDGDEARAAEPGPLEPGPASAAHARGIDPVTGLATREQLVADLDRRLRAQDDGTVLAVCTIDIDRFQVLNDRHGHAVGDRILQHLGRRLARQPDVVLASRIAADEFLAVVSVEGPEDTAWATGERFVTLAAAPMQIGGDEVHLTVTVGIATAADVTGEELVRRSGIALHRARDLGQSVRIVDADEVDWSVQRFHQQHDLDVRIRTGPRRMAFQPIHRVVDGALVGVEALLRWPDLLEPTESLIAIAEQSGSIHDIGRWTLGESIGSIAPLSAAAGRPIRMSVNLSARQLHEPGLVPHILDLLTTHAVPAAQLCVELTETTAMADRGVTIAVLTELRDAGISIAMDDFGIGYSSFAHLRDLPIDEVKIDRSFLVGAESDPAARQIVEGMIRLCTGLGLSVTAEGVEHEDQLEILVEHDCHHWQGFLSAQPIWLEDLIERISGGQTDLPLAGRDNLRALADHADLPDVMVFQRLSSTRYAHIGGLGRGEAWAGIVEIDLAAHPVLGAELSHRGISVLHHQDAVHVVGPYHARTAAVLVVADCLVVLGNPAQVVHLDFDLVRRLAVHAAEEIRTVSPAKPLADEVEVLEAVQELLRFTGEGVDAAVHHLLVTLLSALSCDIGIVALPDRAPVVVGLPAAIADGALPVLGAIASGGNRWTQSVGDGPPLGSLSTLDLRSWSVLRVGDHGGFAFLAHTGEEPRGFTDLCQRLASTLIDTSGVLLDSATARQRLAEQLAAVARDARTDTLTGVGNRLAWEEALAARPAEHPSTVLLADVHGFTSINDRHGHVAGDTVLREVAAALAARCGERGLVCRLGGDAFAILLVGHERVMEATVREICADLTIGISSEGVPYRLAIGWTTVQPGQSARRAMQIADASMHRQKRLTIHV